VLGRGLGLLSCPAQVEELVQSRDHKDLLDLRTQVAHDQVPAPGKQLLVQADQRAERRAGDVLHVAEVEEQVRLARFLRQGEELVVDAVERFFIQRYVAAGEVNGGRFTGRTFLQGRTLTLYCHQ